MTGSRDVEIQDLASDSRMVRPGSLFVALRGDHHDGHVFLPNAVHQGAAAAVVEETAVLPMLKAEIPMVRVTDSRLALVRLARCFYGTPSFRLGMIGVTGTNGKTTVTYLVKHILEAAGHRAGLLGTVIYDLAGEVMVSSFTTPDPISLQGFLARMADRGAAYAVMEVSSHGLALNRVEGCEFDVAVFTNLSQDHLDFHHTMEAYFGSKQKLFAGLSEPRPGGETPDRTRRALINRDDPWGRRLLESVRAPVWTYGLEPGADLAATDIRCGMEGMIFTAITPQGSFPVRSRLVERHNVYNLLAAIGVAVHLGIPSEKIQQGIESLPGIPGRFERLDCGQAFNVIVDYAHTEDALDRLLRTVGELTDGRVITVFGCGGDRDRGKRAPMGWTAARLSDRVLITSDNPRNENPMEIIKEIEAGVAEEASGVEVIVLPDRREAIERALGLARPGDSVVIAGKGHEEYQQVGNRKLPFDDRKIAGDWFRKRGPGDSARGA